MAGPLHDDRNRCAAERSLDRSAFFHVPILGSAPRDARGTGDHARSPLRSAVRFFRRGGPVWPPARFDFQPAL